MTHEIYNDDDLTPEKRDELEAMGLTQTDPIERSTTKVDGTWAHVAAMERSHQWRVSRGMPSNKSCRACGDTLDSGMRYCPGYGEQQPATGPQFVERRLDMPLLERTDGAL